MGNDLDNKVPPRVLVHVSAVFDREPVTKKVLRVVRVSDIRYTVSRQALNYFNRFRDQGVVLELFHYYDDGWPAKALWKELQDWHSPFHVMLDFDNPAALSDYLSYFYDVKHVVDPLNPIRFGSRHMDYI